MDMTRKLVEIFISFKFKPKKWGNEIKIFVITTIEEHNSLV